ncbi:MAG: MarR family winged helix-turn-helix transcriptional regulator [Amaricoccus sp.]|uniref:MarR family winged helix-turn-helix transcriptional regulator n=1 Tax=Amaricoccus sp. TaxID=1872485 RepID=UPI0039E66438
MPAMQNNSPSLGYLLADASRLLRRRFDQQSRDLPMTSAQLQVIARLARNEGISQAALAGLLDIEPMTLSRHVDRMEVAGLVVRQPDPSDRRARRLFTTELARDLLAPMRARAEALYEEALAGVGPAQRETLFVALQAMIDNLSAGLAAGHETNPDDRGAAEKEIA